MYTPIILDKTRNFRYGMRAVSLIEDAFGKNIAKVDLGNLTMKETATIIWAGLVHEDRELTPDKILDLIDNHSSIDAVAAVMTKAFDKSFGSSGNGEEKN